MPSHSEVTQSPYSPEQLYALVIDIERYPEFLPWCRAARIPELHADYFLGELVISFAGMTENYVSKVVGKTPESIEVELVRGPFEHLSNHWRFVPKDGGTEINFTVDFAFKSRMLERLIGSVFTRAVEKMGAAFAIRADALYGRKET